MLTGLKQLLELKLELYKKGVMHSILTADGHEDAALPPYAAAQQQLYAPLTADIMTF